MIISGLNNNRRSKTRLYYQYIHSLLPLFGLAHLQVFLYSSETVQPIEHSENKFITHFENKAGPGVIESSVQKTYTLRKTLTERTESTHDLWQILLIFGNLTALEFVERWTRALQVSSRFQTVQIA